MKVYQIISEATPPEIRPSQRAAARNAVLAANQQAAQAAAAQAAAAQAAAAQAAMTPKQLAQAEVDSIKTKNAAARAGTNKLDIFTKSIIAGEEKTLIKKVWDQLKVEETAAGLAKYNSFLASTLGKALKWGVPSAGLLLIARGYYNAVSNLEIMYEDGRIDDLAKKMSKPISPQDLFRSFIDQTNTILTAQVLAWVVHAVADVKIAAMIAKSIIRIGSISSAGATFGASLIALLATEAGFIAFEALITSESGRNWLANTILTDGIIGIGSFQSDAFDYATQYFAKQDTKKKLAAAKTPQQRAEVQQEIDNAKSDKQSADDRAAVRAKMNR